MRLFGRKAPAPVTVVFSHGYCLNQDSWHFQRAALRGVVRTVHWDQRSHGRSGRGVAQSTDGTPVTIDQLGRDLKAVIDAAAPEGSVVLVGHSMGGMTVMALADQYPELIRDRVVAVALVGTSSGRLGEVNFGLPVAGVNAVRRVLPGVLKALGQQAALVERGRRATADLFAGIIKRYSFASRDVDPAIARFAERMIEGTPIDVVAEFYPAFTDHDKTEALARFADMPVLVLAGCRGHGDAQRAQRGDRRPAARRRAGARTGRRAPGHAGAPRGGHGPPRRPSDARGRRPGRGYRGRLWKHQQHRTTRLSPPPRVASGSPSTRPSRCGSWVFTWPICCARVTW